MFIIIVALIVCSSSPILAIASQAVLVPGHLAHAPVRPGAGDPGASALGTLCSCLEGELRGVPRKGGLNIGRFEGLNMFSRPRAPTRACARAKRPRRRRGGELFVLLHVCLLYALFVETPRRGTPGRGLSFEGSRTPESRSGKSSVSWGRPKEARA